MKHTIVIFILLFSQVALAKHDHPSVHGMLVLGKSKIYLSHLPMFHSPHDYQVIVEAQMSGRAREVYLRSLEDSGEKVYTLVPEVFVLPEMIKNPRSFKGVLYKGHFERGGKVLINETTINITKVIYFKKLEPNSPRPLSAEYLLFGENKDQYMAHLISARPNFDQLLKVKTFLGPTHGSAQEMVFNSIKDSDPLNGGMVLEGKIEVESDLYLEFGDLE